MCVCVCVFPFDCSPKEKTEAYLSVFLISWRQLHTFNIHKAQFFILPHRYTKLDLWKDLDLHFLAWECKITSISRGIKWSFGTAMSAHVWPFVPYRSTFQMWRKWSGWIRWLHLFNVLLWVFYACPLPHILYSTRRWLCGVWVTWLLSLPLHQHQ